MKLHVEIQGQGYPVLCLHGHPGNGRCMAVFTESLSQRFMTLAPDLRGYGRSRTRQPFAMADHLEDLIALLDQQHIHQCLVLGWSLGGILALELALRQPQRVSGLILLGTAARPWGDHPPTTWQDLVYTAIASCLNWVRPGWSWNIETFGRRSLYRYLIQQHTSAAYQRLASEAWPAFWQTSRLAHQALSAALRQGYNQMPALAALPHPALVLSGACDRHITAASSQATAEALAHSTYKSYPQTAHLFPWEVPTQVLADIEHWLHHHEGQAIPPENAIASTGQ